MMAVKLNSFSCEKCLQLFQHNLLNIFHPAISFKKNEEKKKSFGEKKNFFFRGKNFF